MCPVFVFSELFDVHGRTRCCKTLHLRGAFQQLKGLFPPHVIRIMPLPSRMIRAASWFSTILQSRRVESCGRSPTTLCSGGLSKYEYTVRFCPDQELGHESWVNVANKVIKDHQSRKCLRNLLYMVALSYCFSKSSLWFGRTP